MPCCVRQNRIAPSIPSFCSLSWKAGRNTLRFVRALKLSSSRQTTSDAATIDMPNIGMAKYQSSRTNFQKDSIVTSLFLFVVSELGLADDLLLDIAGNRVVVAEFH